MMGIVPFSFNDVNKDIQERETVWGGEHKESRREERDTKKSERYGLREEEEEERQIY